MTVSIVSATPETKRPSHFKVGDKVNFYHSGLLGGRTKAGALVCKVIMVGEFDNDLFGGEPVDPANPPVVYGYNLQRFKSGDIYIGVPQFYLSANRK